MNLLKSDKGLFALFAGLEIIVNILSYVRDFPDWIAPLTRLLWLMIVPVFTLMSIRLDRSKRQIKGSRNFLLLLSYLLFYFSVAILIFMMIYFYIRIFTTT